MSELVILRAGDVKISWNSENEKEITIVKEIFEKKIKEGWSAFRETFKGEKGERIKIFDRDVERIVLVPQISGG